MSTPQPGAVDRFRHGSRARSTVAAWVERGTDVDAASSRWGHLFDDLEGQLEHELAVEELDLRGEEERLRLGRLGLRDRLVALNASSPEVPLTLHTRGGERLRVVPSTIGRDWLGGRLVEESRRPRQCIVPLSAVACLALSPPDVGRSLAAARSQEPALDARLGIAFVLRDLCRRRHGIDAFVAEERMHGTIDRVGRDHFDLALHGADEPRRASAVTGYRVIAFDLLDLITL